MEANASYGAAIGATRVLMCSLRLARGCHGDGVSERKARGGHVPNLTLKLRESTVSATQLSFTDGITATFTAEDPSMRKSSIAVQSAIGAPRVSAFLEVVLKL